MSQKTQKKTKDLQSKRDLFYEEFIKWIALPKPLREPRTHLELAEKYGVDKATLSQWKHKDGFWDEVRKEMKQWARDKTPNVIQAIYQKILKYGNAQEAKLWLQFIEDWKEKSEVDVGGKSIEALEASIRKLLKKK
ncbi:phBC6A51 family helix-turn-helix protein [Patescibacteria group bacterium AH-259-L07]|nr:phBC6A51 family helix-turn-helix protein [Patescibacteria group bacterium AH-259-L07]